MRLDRQRMRDTAAGAQPRFSRWTQQPATRVANAADGRLCPPCTSTAEFLPLHVPGTTQGSVRACDV